MKSLKIYKEQAPRALFQVAFVILMQIFSMSSCWAEILGVANVEIVARLTGPGAINNTSAVGIGGTDLGHMVNHEGLTYFLFGDTFSGDTPSAGGCWRMNVMAYSSDPTPNDGIVFDGWINGDPVCGNAGWARQVIDSGLSEPYKITEIPTAAISLNGRVYAWFMSVYEWAGNGNWFANYGGLAHWDVGEPEFTVVTDFQFPGTGNFVMVAASLRADLAPGVDDKLYVWGTPPGRHGGVKLARVDPENVDIFAAYEYFAGLDSQNDPLWISDEFSAPLIVEPTVGEMSVMWNEAAQAWTMLYLNHDAWAIELREAPEPWGPWSQPITVARGEDFPGGLYGSYMNPLYIESQGKVFYFTMSLWEPYDVFLVKAKLNIVNPQYGSSVAPIPMLSLSSRCMLVIMLMILACRQRIRFRRCSR